MTVALNANLTASHRQVRFLIYAVIASVGVGAAAAFGLLNENSGEASFFDIRRILLATTAFGVLGPVLLYGLGPRLRVVAWAFPVLCFLFYQCHVLITFFYDLTGSVLYGSLIGFVTPFAAWVFAAIFFSRTKTPTILSFFALAGGASGTISAGYAFIQNETRPEIARINQAVDAYTRPVPLAVDTAEAPTSSISSLIAMVTQRHCNASMALT